MQDPTQGLSPSDIKNLTSLQSLGIDPKLINTAIDTGIKLSIALTVVFVMYMIINIVKRWKSEKAMVTMSKDIRVIRELLEQQVTSKPSAAPPTEPVQHLDTSKDYLAK